MKLPDIPAPGEPIPASWGKEVVEYLRSLTPVASPTVLPQQTPGGTSFMAMPPRNRTVSSIVRIDTLVVGGAKAWAEAEWTRTETEGAATNVVYCPYDGVTAPSYRAAMPARTTMPADDGSDDRADGMYINLARVPGPEFHVHRA